MSRKVELSPNFSFRWHNHLDPGVKKVPLSEEEERTIFRGYRIHGNRWADIAKLLNGRPDNLVKNFFYSTLRRQLRKIFKKIKGKKHRDPSEITLTYIHQIMKENNIPYSDLDNVSVRETLEAMDAGDVPNEPAETPNNYSLYLFFCEIRCRRSPANKRKKSSPSEDSHQQDDESTPEEEHKLPVKPEETKPPAKEPPTTRVIYEPVPIVPRFSAAPPHSLDTPTAVSAVHIP